MKLAVLTALWKRRDIAALMLSNLQSVRDELRADGIELSVLAVGSEGSTTARLVGEYGAEYVEYPNQPLGEKWNVGLLYCESLDPDAIVVIGSDNFPNAALFRIWAGYLRDGYEYVGFLDAFMFEVTSWRLLHWFGYPKTHYRHGEPVGSGRCFSAALLERLDWILWDSTKKTSLDWSTTQRLEKVAPRSKAIHMANGMFHLGIKTHENICKFEQFVADTGNGRLIEPDELLISQFGGELVEKLRQIGERRRLQHG